MFQKIHKTVHPPEVPTLVWDGACGFCKYWVTNWQSLSGSSVAYIPYQEIPSKFPDIRERYFRQASRLIDMDGNIYGGPASAYRSLKIAGKYAFLDSWYQRSSLFMKFSDKCYDFIARNRSFMFRITKLMFGSDPENLKPFWVIYLGIFVYLIYLIASW